MNTKALQVSPVLKKVCYPRFVKIFFRLSLLFFVVHPYQDHIWAETFSQWVGGGGAEDGGEQRRIDFDGS